MLYIYIPFAHFFHPLFFCKNFVPKFITRAKNISRTTAAAVAVVQFIRVLRSCVFACVCVCVCVWEKIARRVRRWATVNARNNPAGIRDTARGISKVEGVNEKKKKTTIEREQHYDSRINSAYRFSDVRRDVCARTSGFYTRSLAVPNRS